MTINTEELLALPVEEKLRIMELLRENVGEEVFPGQSLPPLSDEWLEEIKRRSAEYDEGLVTPVPWGMVRAEAKG